jgi:hypothetical protein
VTDTNEESGSAGRVERPVAEDARAGRETSHRSHPKAFYGWLPPVSPSIGVSSTRPIAALLSLNEKDVYYLLAAKRTSRDSGPTPDQRGRTGLAPAVSVGLPFSDSRSHRLPPRGAGRPLSIAARSATRPPNTPDNRPATHTLVCVCPRNTPRRGLLRLPRSGATASRDPTSKNNFLSLTQDYSRSQRTREA